MGKIVFYLGWTGSGVIGVQEVVKSELVKTIMPSADKITQTCAESPTWFIYIPAVAGIMLILKYAIDMILNVIFKVLEYKKLKNEQQADGDDIS